MAFTIRNLAVLSYAQGFTHWHYCANVQTLGATLINPVTMAEASSEGFFNPTADMMNSGDLIVVSAADGMVQLYVTATEGGVKTKPVCATEADHG